MHEPLGEILADFEAVVGRFRNALSTEQAVLDVVFSDAKEWLNLLTYKLVPHLAGEGCLIAAVTGGTNTGKSTVFNLLLGRPVSPVLATAAATRHPVLVGNAMRAAQCLDAKLLPEFAPLALDDSSLATNQGIPVETLLVGVDASLPDRLVLLDTPDVDSIEKEHWQVADNIRAAGDVLIAVLTAEKYQDDRVVSFFQRAFRSGRVVTPLMNKANPADDFAVARKQLAGFCDATGVTGPCFAVAHDFKLSDHCKGSIPCLSGGPSLRDYLESLDVPAIKREVYGSSVRQFAASACVFLDQAAKVGNRLKGVVREFESRAHQAAQHYDPAPGPEVSGLFHEFVQSRRGSLRRIIGSASKEIAARTGWVARTIASAWKKRARLESETAHVTEKELQQMHRRAIDQITRDLATQCVEFAQNLHEPAASLVSGTFESVDVDEVARKVAQQTVSSEDVSQEFRRHAYRMLETWWNGHKGQRRALEAIDALLAVAPAAIAVPISLYTGGFGVSEAVVFAGPFVEQFVARVIEYQFGDALFDFLSPWRAEQRQALENALLRHLIRPCIDRIQNILGPFDEGMLGELKSLHERCLKAL
jgi:hypothetical protein